MQRSISEKAIVGDISGDTDWVAALQEVDVVVHAAARAHVPNDRRDNAALYFAVNGAGTKRLAETAARSGVAKFVLLSTVKVNGEDSGSGVFGPQDEAHPADDYARSKWLGEQALREIGSMSAMRVAIVRPPLVYGPEVRANFLRLLKWVDARRPLPLAGVENRRSLVSVWNLCDLLLNIIRNDAANGGIWLLSDGEDLSTPELIRRIGRAMGRPVRLFNVRPLVLRVAGAVLGRRQEIARLCGSLRVDIGETRARLGWSPPDPVDEALARTVRWYLNERRGRAV